MAEVNGCNIPEDLYYVVQEHVWARPDGDVVTVGMTDVAQSLAKGIIAVTAKAVGKRIVKGKSVATVESGKWVGPVPSPVNGELIEVNAAVVKSPGTINADPYGDGWIAKLRADDWAADSADLATGAEGVEVYRSFLEAEGIACGG